MKKWEKRYSVRLSNGDETLFEYLENLPSNQRAAQMRKLMLNSLEGNSKGMDELKAEIEALKQQQAIFFEEIKELLSSIPLQMQAIPVVSSQAVTAIDSGSESSNLVQEEQEEVDVTEDDMVDIAEQMIAGFGGYEF